MPAAFDAEGYLRTVAERAVGDPQFPRSRRRWASAVFEVASALVAVGCLDVGVAQELVHDYETKLAQLGRVHHPRPYAQFTAEQRANPVGRQLAKPRVIVTEQDLTRPWGRLRLHYLVLGDRSTAVFASDPDAPRAYQRWPEGRIQPGTSVREWIDVTDDLGSTQLLEVWQGGPRRFSTDVPLSPATPWLWFAQERVDLAARELAPSCHVESLPFVAPAVAHLWRRLATYFCFFPLPGPPPLVEFSIQALLAAGALESNSPEIDQVRNVAFAFTDSELPTAALPKRWASLLSGFQRAAGPEGVVAVGGYFARLGDSSLILEGLLSGVSEFRLYVTVSPAWQLTGAHGLEALSPLSWWAEDDRCNHYLGYPSDMHEAAAGLGDGAQGSIRFWPGLDPSTTELRILPAAAGQQAVCTVPLSRWAR